MAKELKLAVIATDRAAVNNVYFKFFILKTV